jgi:hypothetical protein
MSTEIDRLIVVFDANFKALNDKLDKAIARNKQAAKDIESAWAGKGIFGAIEEGLTSFTDHLGEAAKGIPVFGAALGALGPVGVVATAAVGGFALVMEQTEKATEYAAGIGKLAATIGVSTDFIQKFNFAARQSEVDVGAADNALKALNASVGAVQGNLPRAKQLITVFTDALNITPEQLRSYHSLEDLFPVIADRIAQAGSAAEKAAIAKKLGVEELLPMLNKGAAGFAALSKEAENLGVVISASTIEKAAEAQTKLKALDDLMQAQKASTFVEYANTLIKIKTAFNDATLAALGFLAAITRSQPTQQRIDLLDASIEGLKKQDGGHPQPVAQGLIKQYQTERDALAKQRDEEDLKRWNEALKAQDQPPAKQIIPTKTKTPPKDETEALTKTALDVYQTALKGLASAQAQLTDSLTERNVLEKKAIDDELTKQQGDINANIAKVNEARKKGVDTNADAQLKQLEAAKVIDAQIAQDKKLLLDKQLLTSLFDAEIAHEQAVADLQAVAFTANSAHLTSLANLTNSTTDRATFERAALQQQQAAERVLAEAKLKEAQDHLDYSKWILGASEDVTKPQQDAVNAAKAALNNLTQSQTDKAAELNKSLENPLQKYIDGITDLNTQMETWAAGGLNDLATGFAKAVVEGGKLTDVAKSIFQKIAEDMIQSFVEQNLTKPAASFLSTLFTPHAAGDLTGSAGGLSLVGEDGPELVNLPGGSRILSNNQLRQVGLGASGSTGQTIVFDNRGAVIWEQAAKAMMAYADRSAATAGVGAVQMSREATPADLARASARSLG